MEKLEWHFGAVSTDDSRSSGFSRSGVAHLNHSCFAMLSTNSSLHIERYHSVYQRLLSSGSICSTQWPIFEQSARGLRKDSLSFLRVLTTLSDYENVIKLLAGALYEDTPSLELFDGFTDRYVARRVDHRLSHTSAFEEMGVLRLMKAWSESSMDDPSRSQRLDNISDDYYVV